ncbi:MAG: nucleotide exchange factor GrpE [bacterium]|nr:nucleotide exchange factor GrpE [bacterium]
MKEIDSLRKQLADKEEITKRAQSDYLRLKLDMDTYIQRTEGAKQEMKIEGFIQIAKKLLPAVDQLKLTLDHCPKELHGTPRVQGIEMIYNKLVKELETLGIQPIITQIGTEPNLHYHAPVSTEPVKDEKQKGKISKEVQQGYIYKDNDHEYVILPATVVV